METYDALTAALLTQYRALFSVPSCFPDWAVRKIHCPDEPVKATIPFIGKEYARQDVKILIYASAENLANYYAGSGYWPGEWLDDDGQAVNRHRRCFEKPELQNGWFPHVHMAPMNDGCLATAAFYLANKIRTYDASITPREFYETIAFANYGKYSIETEKQRNIRLGQGKSGAGSNVDYAGNMALMEASREYVRADLRTLQPDYIIMPETVYRADRAFVDECRGSAEVIGIYQMNVSVINRIIRPRYPLTDPEALPIAVRNWYDNMQSGRMHDGSKSKENYRAVFSYLDEKWAEVLRRTVR